MMRVFVSQASIHQNVTLTEELFNSLVDRIFILGMQSVSCDSMTEMGTTWGLSNKYFWSPIYLIMVSTECQWPRLILKSQDNNITRKNWSAARCKFILFPSWEWQQSVFTGCHRYSLRLRICLCCIQCFCQNANPWTPKQHGLFTATVLLNKEPI